MRRFFSFLIGALVGGLVGAVTAILLAPASGTDLRGQMRERAYRLKDEVKSAAATRRAELEEQLASLRAPHRIE